MSWTHEHQCAVAAPVASVFTALTEVDALQAWFAESVEVVPEVGGSYRFWGRHTIGTPSASDVAQRITAFEAGHRLAFTWSVLGVATEVTIDLAEQDGATAVVLAHRVDGELPMTRPRELVDDFWRLMLGNLMEHCSGGSGVMRPDFGDPSPEIHLTRVMPVAARPLWRALTEADSVNQWFNTSCAVVEPRVGGTYRVDWRYMIDGRAVVGGPTRILEMDRPHRLQLDWPDWRGDATMDGQTVTFCLFPTPDGTKVTFIHAGFTRASDVGDYPFGWACFLAQLETEAVRLAKEGKAPY